MDFTTNSPTLGFKLRLKFENFENYGQLFQNKGLEL